MKRILTLICLIACVSWLSAQNNTAEYVYSILQSRCASCHGNSNPAGGLDLKGTGANQAAQMADVYARLFDQASLNAYSSSQNYKLVYPGQPERSTLFRQIHAGLQSNLQLDPAEGNDHSDPGDHTILNYEKEAIRQWINFGAPPSGKVVDVPMLQRYYNGDSIPSFSTPPPAPDPSKGFQVHLGPFFLEENGEEEFFIKYPTHLPQDVEITRIESIFGQYSHHFILFDYHPNLHTLKGEGLRYDNAHSYTRLMTANQFSDTLNLPEGSAFSMEAGSHLDLNSHYINYSSDKVAACEVYVNIFTQPKGIAKQEMEVALVANTSIVIPADSQTRTFNAVVNDPSNPNDIYVWAMTTHTHKYGTDFNVFTRNTFGQPDDMLFDAEYMDGDPTGLYQGYDYQHPPIRYYEPFIPVPMNLGLIYQASYRNTGSQTVRWGDTSDDEMMVMIFFYLTDTAGVTLGPGTAVDPRYEGAEISIGPNPFSELTYLNIDELSVSSVKMELYDQVGRSVRQGLLNQLSPNTSNTLVIERGTLPSGIYLLNLRDDRDQIIYSTKLFIH